MKLRLNCRFPSCEAKNSMVVVSYFDKEKRADKACFYICSRCSMPSDWVKIPFNKEQTGFQILLIKGRGQYQILEMQRTHEPKCIFCSNSFMRYKNMRYLNKKEAYNRIFWEIIDDAISRIPNCPDKANTLWIECEECKIKGMPKSGFLKPDSYHSVSHFLTNIQLPYFVDKSCIVKMYIESTKLKIDRTFAGYLCLACNRICFMNDLPKINWNPSYELRDLEFVILELNKKDSPDKVIKYDSLVFLNRYSAPIG